MYRNYPGGTPLPFANGIMYVSYSLVIVKIAGHRAGLLFKVYAIICVYTVKYNFWLWLAACQAGMLTPHALLLPALRILLWAMQAYILNNKFNGGGWLVKQGFANFIYIFKAVIIAMINVQLIYN